jgi:glutathione synthase/RimK-type ligase-like ATP-grasp enzyme
MSERTAITSKWEKTKMLVGSPALAPHVPETKRMNGRTLKKLLDRYGMAYVKPVSGSLGNGVMKVEREAQGTYRIHAGTRQKRLSTYREAYRWIDAHKRNRPYLAQRGIRVLRFGGRPVDFRVMIQRRSDRTWEVTGKLARVAHPLKAVTNGSQGGSIYPVDRVLARKAGRTRAQRLLRTFDRLARLTARRFGRFHPRMNELGLDIAVDGKLRAWILEVNTRPDPKPFKLLPDPAMLRRIVRLARGYGQTYNLKITKARRG